MKINTIIARLKKYQPQMQLISINAAAVIVFLIIDENDDIYFLLTKRTQNGPYAGDYCFPGGKSEESDLKITAIREINEELGLVASDFQIIGQLDDFEDRYGHTVRPYVAIIEKFNIQHLKPNPDEIEKIYYLPLDEILNIQLNPKLAVKTLRQPSYSYTKDDVFIWGLTASILVHIGNIIFALNKKIGKFINNLSQ